jgi:S1-C subfamily serine protease
LEEERLFMKESFLRAAAWLSLSLLIALSFAPSAIAADGECDQSAAAIYQTASPAVIFISATSINPYRVADRVEHVVGSGFIINGEGLALTNSHVVFGRQSLTVRLNDGTTLPARLLGADPILDIAVLQIPKPEDGKLPVLALGDSDSVRVGEDVLALGNPLGLEQSLTRGIVSAVNRVLPATFFSLQEPLIQVDTPINHGNSGGPLLNRCGEVIGITTAIISDAQNIGLVIPINLAKAALPGLLKDGHLARPWLGFHGQFIDNNLRRLLRLPLRTGFLVEAVEPGSPAEQAQLQGGDMEMTIAGDDFLLGGDIITVMNGKRLDSPESVINALQELKVGGELSMTIFREGKTQEVKYKLPERPLLPGDISGQSDAMQVNGCQAIKTARLKF